MRKLVLPALAALAFVAPAPAQALIFLGLRGGYALPSGDSAKGQPMKDGVKANVPFQVDAGVSVFPYVGLGLYGSLGPTTVASSVKATCGASCSGQNLRAGLQLVLRVPVIDSLWAGAFGGYEQQKLSGGSYSATYKGWEAGLQGGWDFTLLPLIKVGPFVSYSIGQYQMVSGTALPATGTIKDKAQHSQLTFGLRALFDL